LVHHHDRRSATRSSFLGGIHFKQQLESNVPYPAHSFVLRAMIAANARRKCRVE
jgi:hypothetical protein